MREHYTTHVSTEDTPIKRPWSNVKAKNNLDFVKMKLTNLDTVFHSTMFDFNVNCLVLKTQMIRKAISPGSNTGLMVGNMWDFL